MASSSFLTGVTKQTRVLFTEKYLQNFVESLSKLNPPEISIIMIWNIPIIYFLQCWNQNFSQMMSRMITYRSLS